MTSRFACVLLLLCTWCHVAPAQQIIDATTAYTPAQVAEAKRNLEKWQGIVTSGQAGAYSITEGGYLVAKIDDARGKLLWLPQGNRDSITKVVIDPGQRFVGLLVPAGETKPRLVTIEPETFKRVLLIGVKPGEVQLSIIANGKDGAEPEELRTVSVAVSPLVQPGPPKPVEPKPEDIKSDDKLVLAALEDIKAGKGTIQQAMNLVAFYARVGQTIEGTDVFKTYGDFYGSLVECGKALAGEPGAVLPSFRAQVAEHYKQAIGGTMAQAFDKEAQAKVARVFKELSARLSVIK